HRARSGRGAAAGTGQAGSARGTPAEGRRVPSGLAHAGPMPGARHLQQHVLLHRRHDERERIDLRATRPTGQRAGFVRPLEQRTVAVPAADRKSAARRPAAPLPRAARHGSARRTVESAPCAGLVRAGPAGARDRGATLRGGRRALPRAAAAAVLPLGPAPLRSRANRSGSAADVSVGARLSAPVATRRAAPTEPVVGPNLLLGALVW